MNIHPQSSRIFLMDKVQMTSTSFISFDKFPKSTIKVNIKDMSYQLDKIEMRREKRKYEEMSKILKKARKKVDVVFEETSSPIKSNAKVVPSPRSPPTSTK